MAGTGARPRDTATSATSATSAPSRAGTARTRWLRVVAGELFAYRHTWRGSVASSTLLPLLFLGAFGLGLGTLVERGGGRLDGGVSFLAFVAPGLLAASTFQVGMADTMWPARGGITWFGHYRALVATSVGTTDLALGLLGWYTLRLVVTVVPYALAAVLFGAVAPLRAVAMTGPALLLGAVGVAASLFVAWGAESEDLLSLTYRVVIVPAFLLSGAFFPISDLPGPVLALAWINPVLHGVELTRTVALGTPPAVPSAVSVAVLVALVPICAAGAARALRRRLRA